MKNAELKKMFKNKFVIRVAAGAVTIAVIGTGAGISYTVRAEKKTETVQETEETKDDMQKDTEQKLVNTLSNQTSENTKAGKEETVYVVADADGTTKNVIVSEWLKNKDNQDTLKDVSDLKEITNVKGNEKFEQTGDKVTWQADGNDIYYQGTTEKELPVTEKVTYSMDGKEMSPEEIAGKSGKVTIRFDYTNHEKTTELVDGEEHEVYVPFTVMTGMILPEKCDNVEVTNGKIISDGSKKIVVGVAMPGLKESLNIKEGELDQGLEIPNYVEVSADVTDFSLDMTMSVMMSDLISEANLDEAFDLTKLEDSINTMTDASSKLVDGSTQLANGLDTLKSSMKEFAGGVTTLKEGITSYTTGATQLNDGICTLKNGAGALVTGAGQLGTGVNAIYDNFGTMDNQGTIRGGAAAVAAGTKDLSTGASTLSQGANQVSGGANQVSQGAGGLSQGASNLSQGANQVSQGAAQVSQGVTDVKTGIDQLDATVGNAANVQKLAAQLAGDFDGAKIAGNTPEQVAGMLKQKGMDDSSAKMAASIYSLYQGSTSNNAEDFIYGVASTMSMIDNSIQPLIEGAGALSTGAAQTATGAAQVAEGATELSQGAAALSQGATQTAAGAAQVADGATGISQGSKTLEAGATKLQGGVEMLYGQAITPVHEGASSLIASIPTLTGGIDQLSAGASTLVSNNGALLDGTAKLSGATTQLTEGVDKLESGSNDLMEGMVQFNKEGIQKLADAYHGDVKTLLSKLEAVVNAGEEYQTFTKVSDQTTGSVKFVVRTEAVKAEGK
ncbi:MAG: hypothetical protein RR139_09015 [Lachnospiraceae bacterium]